MAKRRRLPKSIRKYIRREKGRLRREILDLAEQEKKIDQIYQKLGIKRDEPTTSRSVQSTEIGQSSPPQRGLPKKK